MRPRRNSAAIAGVSAEVRQGLRGSIENIAKAAGISEELVTNHLDQLVTRALTKLSREYVNEMGNAVERVGDARKVVHKYYERAFKKRLAAGEMVELREALDRLGKATRELVSPDEWARRQLGRSSREPVPAQEREPFVELGDIDVDAHRPGRKPLAPEPATVAPRWAASRTLRQRFEALPASGRLALEQAGKFLEPATVEHALAGRPGAVTAMVNDLKGLLAPEELRAALDAVAMVQHPDPAYVLGGGLGGSRPPAEPVRAAYEALPPAERAAFDRAAAADPEFVRAAVVAETSGGVKAVQDPDLGRALTRLNLGQQAARGAVERGIGSSVDAQSRAVLFREQTAALGLPSEGRVAEQLRGSAMLRDLGTRNPDKLLDLARGWLDKVARDTREGKPPVSMEEYVRVLMDTNERGMGGEFGAVFQLGKLVEGGKLGEGVLVLKAPGTDVNVSGTDFIVVLPKSDEIWLCDNKTLSTAGLGEVTSLVERIGSNLTKDVEQLRARLADLDPTLPGAARVRGAMERLARADAQVRGVLDQLAREKDFGRLTADQINKEISAPEVQNRIAAILDHPDIRVRRVITNAGGELTYLQERLSDRKIDLADLRQRSDALLDVLAKAKASRTAPQGGTTP